MATFNAMQQLPLGKADTSNEPLHLGETTLVDCGSSLKALEEFTNTKSESIYPIYPFGVAQRVHVMSDGRRWTHDEDDYWCLVQD